MSSVKVFVVPAKFQKKRLEDMKTSMRKKGINLTDNLSNEVTHIVSECDSLEQVNRQLAKERDPAPPSAQIVSTRWLIECLKASAVVPVADSHLLKKEKTSVPDQTANSSQIQDSSKFPEWACQRPTKLSHLNLKLTSAIETLQEHAELRDGNQDYSRALAFRRASSVLKALPFAVQSIDQLTGYKDIGVHVKEIILDVLDHGSSSEVESIVNSPWYIKMKLFTSVFGVGPSTAKAWIDRGWETIDDVSKDGCPSGDWRIAWGLAFLNELNTAVSVQEADAFKKVVEEEAEKLLPGVIVTLVGGFRRGKSNGHDVDILLSHPSEGAEIDLLPRLLSVLSRRGLILIGHREKSTFRSDVLYQDFKLSSRGQLDHFEKWLGICKFPKSFSAPTKPDSGSYHETQQGLQGSVCLTSNVSHENPTKSRHHLEAACSVKNVDGDKIETLNGSFDEPYEPKVKKAKTNDSVDEEPKKLAATSRDWLARRVDLIITPYSQYFYALVGWTGSKHFNRDARLYAQKRLGLKLTSHGLFDIQKRESLTAKSEEEVFSHLKLPFLDPTERNC